MQKHTNLTYLWTLLNANRPNQISSTPRSQTKHFTFNQAYPNFISILPHLSILDRFTYSQSEHSPKSLLLSEIAYHGFTIAFLSKPTSAIQKCSTSKTLLPNHTQTGFKPHLLLYSIKTAKVTSPSKSVGHLPHLGSLSLSSYKPQSIHPSIIFILSFLYKVSSFTQNKAFPVDELYTVVSLMKHHLRDATTFLRT